MLLDQPLKKWFTNAQGSDSALKSMLKSISWRIVGTLDTMVIAYFITGQLTMAVSIGSIEVFSKIILYYFHERAWEKVTTTKKEYERSEELV
ncbi:MAG: DUF2061 domain-containing protein [Nitritalea sp.]